LFENESEPMPRTTFDFTRIEKIPNPLYRWYHVPGGRNVTGLKFAFRNLDYAQQADTNIMAFTTAVSATPAAAGAYVDLRVDAARLRSFLDKVHALGSIPYLTFDPKEFANPDVAAQYAYLGQIPQGVWDAKLKEVAGVLRDFGQPVMLRWAHEMNGNWYPYSGAFSGGRSDADQNGVADGPQTYIAAWRYVHALFKAEGATELLWIYSPNAESFPNAEWNGLFSYYPGSKYVDLIAVDVYEHPEQSQRTLAELLDPVYNALGLFWEAHEGDPDYALRAFGLGEYGTSRATLASRIDWYVEAFAAIAADKRIQFHAVYNAQNGAKDFSLGPYSARLEEAYGNGRFAFGPITRNPVEKVASK
jgi:hypothetical protein